MNRKLWLGLVFVSGALWADGLPKPSIQALTKALQDSNQDVRLAAAQALSQFEESQAIKALESALIASTEATEQDALVNALVLNKDSGTAKRLIEALNNPQFTWGKGAKARATETVGKIAGKKAVKWLTDMVVSDQEPDVRAAAARCLGAIGAPPKKEKKD